MWASPFRSNFFGALLKGMSSLQWLQAFFPANLVFPYWLGKPFNLVFLACKFLSGAIGPASSTSIVPASFFLKSLSPTLKEITFFPVWDESPGCKFHVLGLPDCWNGICPRAAPHMLCYAFLNGWLNIQFLSFLQPPRGWLAFILSRSQEWSNFSLTSNSIPVLGERGEKN